MTFTDSLRDSLAHDLLIFVQSSTIQKPVTSLDNGLVYELHVLSLILQIVSAEA